MGPESGAAREQAVIGEVVKGFSQYGRGVHDDLLQRVHRHGARLHRGALVHGATRQGWSKGSDDAVMS